MGDGLGDGLGDGDDGDDGDGEGVGKATGPAPHATSSITEAANAKLCFIGIPTIVAEAPHRAQIQSTRSVKVYLQAPRSSWRWISNRSRTDSNSRFRRRRGHLLMAAVIPNIRLAGLSARRRRYQAAHSEP